MNKVEIILIVSILINIALFILSRVQKREIDEAIEMYLDEMEKNMYYQKKERLKNE
jgi:hypothetical protein